MVLLHRQSNEVRDFFKRISMISGVSDCLSFVITQSRERATSASHPSQPTSDTLEPLTIAFLGIMVNVYTFGDDLFFLGRVPEDPWFLRIQDTDVSWKYYDARDYASTTMKLEHFIKCF